jgi:hypothetical protein
LLAKQQELAFHSSLQTAAEAMKVVKTSIVGHKALIDCTSLEGLQIIS